MEKTAFSIYDASAGSGKTYTLVKEYLKILLTADTNDAYKRILHLENYQPLFAVALGYRSQEDANQPSIKPKLRMPAEAVIQHL